MDRRNTRLHDWRWQERIGVGDKKTLDGDQSIYFNRLMDLGDPIEPYDAVHKKYVDDTFGDGEIIVVIGTIEDIADLDIDTGSFTGSDAGAVMAVHLATYDHTLIGSGGGEAIMAEHLITFDHTNIHPSNIIDGDAVDVAGRHTNDVLTWNGATWVPAPSAIGVAGGIPDFAVAVVLEGTTIKVINNEGATLGTGVLGTDDTDCFDIAVANCPHNGKLYVGPGTFTLLANKIFYLNGGDESSAANPFYYAIGILDGKNVDFCGAGVGSTILKLAPGQHYQNHHAVMILNRAHWWNYGATMFTVTDMTLDGNRSEQDEWYYDGAGLILTGSIASNFKFQRLWLKDSFGYGVYCGNNGSGPVTGLVISDIRATNCYRTAIMTDTVCGLLINNCQIEDSNTGIECVGNQPDYLTRARDSIVISDVICHRAGITLWTVNDATLNSCYMDCTGNPSLYGLLIHSAIRVMVSASKFINNINYKYSTFIDANTYMNDGPCQVFFNNCNFEGSYAFRILGEAEVIMHGGQIQGRRSCVYMVGEDLQPVACKLRMTGVELLALQPVGESPEPTLLLDVATGGYVEMNRCEAPKVGYFQMAAGSNHLIRDCTGPGLEGNNSRWRIEEGTYIATPPSTSTITTLIDRTGVIVAGTPICYQVAGIRYMGIVTNITIDTIFVAGPPISGDIEALFFGVPEMIGQADYVIPGAFAISAGNQLIKTFQKSHSLWRGRPAYLVWVGCIVQALDTTVQPSVNVTINGNPVVVGAGIPVALVLQSTLGNIIPANYKIVNGDVIEIETTAGGTGDASDLTVFFTFVSES